MWTRGSDTYAIALLAKDSKIFFKIAGISVFDYVFLLSVVGTMIIIAINGSGRIRYNDIIEEKNNKAKGGPQAKNAKKPKDILSIRFGASYKKPKNRNNSDSSDDDNEEELLANYGSNR